jgi:photosynthetic reaction center cytochrome c subunit
MRLMTHMSNALGVNCTFCHNTQSFQNWTNSPPQRTTAWHGIRMARDLNLTYMESLTDVFPEHRKEAHWAMWPSSTAPPVTRAYKPLNGAPMAKDFPELLEPALVATKVAAK